MSEKCDKHPPNSSIVEIFRDKKKREQLPPVSTFKATNGGIEVALSAEPTKSIILTVYRLRSKIDIFNSKFFTLSFPFFKTKKKKNGVFSLQRPIIFL